MKIHYRIYKGVDAGCRAIACYNWNHEKLIPYAYRLCDMKMMLLKNDKFFTNDSSKVTCKHCLRKLKSMINIIEKMD